MRKTALILFAFILSFLILSVSVFSISENAVENFRNALRSNNNTAIKQIIHPKGLVLARLYNQNNPHRKQDLLVTLSDIPVDFQVPVNNDLPFDLRYLFGGSIRSRALVYLNETPANNVLNENSIQSIRTFAAAMLRFTNPKTRSFTPTVTYTKEGHLVLVEGEISERMLSGSIAVFMRTGGQYLLRLIIDLK